MTTKHYNVLFICTGNSARSIIAESVMTALGGGRFKAYSAGSHPKGEVNPDALNALKYSHFPVEGLRSKSWNEFATPQAPKLDFVITVCDKAAGEVCPVWPGQPMVAHWGVEDPVEATGSRENVEMKYRDVVLTIKRRVELMLSLPLPSLDRLVLQSELSHIGQR